MIIYSIYKVVNKINGKVYIGFDSNWPKRKEEHYYYLNKRQQTFYCALRKYGWENFEWCVIYQSKDGKHCLQVMERYFITEYNSFNSGYNETFGGEGSLGRILTEETKNKISLKLKNKPKSDEHILKMSETRKGKIPTKETLMKRSNTMKETLRLKKLNNISS
jgi:group I intron endonuclease